jgi:shikimate kinase
LRISSSRGRNGEGKEITAGVPQSEKPMRASPKGSHSSPSSPIVALTGFMAAGKSTIGRELARLLHWRFIDLDCEIELETGLTIRDLFTQHGEEHFRKVETEALRIVLTQSTAPTVIALGGGTFVQPQNAGQLREHGVRVVFLEHDLQKLLQRCRNAGDRSPQNPRPLAVDEAAFCALYAQRLPLYRKADVTVVPREKEAPGVALEVLKALGLHARDHAR